MTLLVAVFDRSYENYTSALYQHDFHLALSNLCSVKFFDLENLDSDPLDLTNIDILIYGYWFFEFSKNRPEEAAKIILKTKYHPCKLFILNKEYVLLKEKVDFVRSINPDYVLSHHHAVRQIFKSDKVETIFSPFGYNDEKFFNDPAEKRDYDLFFSGMIANANQGHFMRPDDLGFRVEVLHYFFRFFGTIPIRKRNLDEQFQVFLNIVSTTPLERKISRFLGLSKYLPINTYSLFMRRSNYVLSSLSPSSLVSTRFYEALASGAVPICQKSNVYKEHGLEDFIVQVSSAKEAMARLAQPISPRKPNSAQLKDFSWRSRVVRILSYVR